MTTDDQTMPDEAEEMKQTRRLDALLRLNAHPDTPWNIGTVEGCNCGGIDIHRAPSANQDGYGCFILELPAHARESRIEDAKRRVYAWSSRHQEDLADLCCVHGRKLDRALELLEDLAKARGIRPDETAHGTRIEGYGGPGNTVNEQEQP